ncbi:TIGR02611 family protein [Streptomyces sp. NPDC047085]|uniref:TIGR02611 family protein n=1 Tax=Streptomyces sp. NPDC047085 TaxID=3155140 RepID=UPI0033D41DE6
MNTGSDEPGEVAMAPKQTDSGDGAAAADGVGGTDTGRADEGRSERGLGSRAPEFVKARRFLHLSWQVGVFVVGLAVVVAGIIMLPLPGPGWVVIFGGMAIWATEFVWAQLVLRWTKRKVTEAAQRALDPRVRRRNITLTVIGLVIVGVLVGIYVWKFGVVMPWKIKDQ